MSADKSNIKVNDKKKSEPDNSKDTEKMNQVSKTKTNNQKSNLESQFNSLSDMVKRKEELTGQLIALEKQIYAFEGNYLQETQIYGNVVRGWDKYLCSTKNFYNGINDPRNKKIKDSDRIFSKSSATLSNYLNENENLK
ncbi:hypothetical protein A3Q56_04069 [Intoshia linei]|uniref:Chromatin modification-related protein MEAF6 n=1 Tax=Intoshia linei TaxID=1819745 RepID=A0A177B3K7_9BILA|nr:hypothetical protein A3Q56_04069 [Intoshia linei]